MNDPLEEHDIINIVAKNRNKSIIFTNMFAILTCYIPFFTTKYPFTFWVLKVKIQLLKKTTKKLCPISPH